MNALNCGLAASFLAVSAQAQIVEDTAKDCSWCEKWNEPQQPFQVFGNTWYVGTAGLAAILVVTDAGLILLDGALSQSAGQVAQNIQTIGFDPLQIKYILNSHAHFDHAGGLNALQQLSQARVLASEASISVLKSGQIAATDPQFGFGAEANAFPPVSQVSLVSDGGTVTLGDVALTAHYTPGHTPGGTTWTWQSCEENRCLNIVYADSLSAVSAEDFRFSNPAPKPTAAEQITASAQLIRELPCDVLLSPHPFLFAMSEKLEAAAGNPAANAFVEEAACEAYADYFDEWLARRLEEETPVP